MVEDRCKEKNSISLFLTYCDITWMVHLPNLTHGEYLKKINSISLFLTYCNITWMVHLRNLTHGDYFKQITCYNPFLLNYKWVLYQGRASHETYLKSSGYLGRVSWILEDLATWVGLVEYLKDRGCETIGDQSSWPLGTSIAGVYWMRLHLRTTHEFNAGNNT